MATNSNEVATREEAGTVVFNDDNVAGNDELNAIQSYQDAMELLGLSKMTEETAKLLDWDTNPYEPVDKADLVGKPFLAIQWRFIGGDFGEFCVVHAVVRLDNGTDWFVLFSDGSTGVKKQLNDLTEKRIADGHPRPQQGALVRGGLSVSNYEVEGPDGKMIPATTYYLSNSKRKS